MTRSILGPGSGVRAIVATVVASICLSGVAVAGPPTGGALPPQITQVVQVAGVGEVPIDAVGVALNVTVTNPAAAGFVTVHPCSSTLPLASNVNYLRDQTVPNLVVSGLDIDGDVCIDTLAVTDVIVDVAGYIPAGSPVQPLVEPVRFLDTRHGIGARRARVGAGQVLQVPVAGTPGVPADAGTVIFNTTVVSPGANGFVTVFPCGQPIPATSSVNFTVGAIVPNLTITAVGAGGAVCLYSTAETDLVADVAAFVPAGATGITMLPSPQRILDTRIGLGGPDLPIGGAVRSVQVTGVVGVPASASAALVNLTATEGTGAGFAAAFPCGVGVPVVSNLNFAAGQDVANAAVVKLAADGTMCLYSNLAVDVIVDVTGYVTGVSALVPVTPVRLLDTRRLVEPRCGVGVAQSPVFGLGPVDYDVVDLATGTIRHRLDGLPGRLLGSMFVLADCRVVAIGSSALVASAGTSYWEFDAAGDLVHEVLLGDFSFGAHVTASDHEVFAIDGSLGVRVVPDQDLLFTLPPPGVDADGTPRLWRFVGASADGTRLALSLDGPDSSVGSRFDVFVFDRVGSQLRLLPLQTGERPIDMSPGGAYLLTRVDSADGPTQYRVITFGGDEIDSFASNVLGGSVRADGWIAEGVISLCDWTPPTIAARTWELFRTEQAPKGLLPCVISVG